jgi:hypothetical protein
MTYWVVMAIVAIAVVAVLIAVGSDEEAPEPIERAAGDRSVWVAVGSNATKPGANDSVSPHWVDLVRDSLGERVVAYDFTRAGCTAEEAQRDQLAAAVATSPDVVSLLIGPDDFHDAEDLGAFERRLWHVLKTLREAGSVPVLATLPNLITLPSLANEENPASLIEEIGAWNVAMERIAAAAGGEIVAWTMMEADATCGLFTEADGRFILTAAGQRWFATLMERPVKRLLGVAGEADSAATESETNETE